MDDALMASPSFLFLVIYCSGAPNIRILGGY